LPWAIATPAFDTLMPGFARISEPATRVNSAFPARSPPSLIRTFAGSPVRAVRDLRHDRLGERVRLEEERIGYGVVEREVRAAARC
jgi:hypothetical protein